MTINNKKIRAGIIGGAGYTGGELIRILLRHPDVDIAYVHSKSNAANPLYQVHQDLLGDTDMKFSDEVRQDIDVLFLCVGHGEASRFLADNPIAEHIRIIDLSQDFRIMAPGNDFMYGLPELNRDDLKSARRIANPGCFATAIQLALLPLAEGGLIENDVNVSGITGSTGAGQSLTETSHYSWRNDNIGTYKMLEHQHLNEILMNIKDLQPAWKHKFNFIPYRGPFSRGIIATCHLDTDMSLEQVKELYEAYYWDQPFTFISQTNVHLKQVTNTNKCLLYLEKHGDTLVITSVIDNLLKGASGQAVQNMNIMFGLDETAGLKLKANYF